MEIMRIINCMKDINWADNDKREKFIDLAVEICKVCSKEVPLIGNTANMLISIRDSYFIEKLNSFINRVKENNISEEELKKYREKYINDPEKLEKELKKLIVVLDSYREKEKVKYLGNLYAAVIKGWINWKCFSEYEYTLNNLYIDDLDDLMEYIKYEKENKYTGFIRQQMDTRLEFLGLVEDRRLTILGFNFLAYMNGKKPEDYKPLVD